MGYCGPMSVSMQIPAHLGGPEAMGFMVLWVCYLRGGESMCTRNVGCTVGSRPARCQLSLVMTIMHQHHLSFIGGPHPSSAKAAETRRQCNTYHLPGANTATK